jgi:hypothetical protein
LTQPNRFAVSNVLPSLYENTVERWHDWIAASLQSGRRNSAEMIPDGEFWYWLRRCFPAARLGIASILATWIGNDDKRDA